MRRIPIVVLSIWVVISILSIGGCGNSSDGVANKSDSVTVIQLNPLPDTLRVGTLYSPASYFIYRETEMGYDYELVSRFVQDKGLVLDLHLAHSLEDALAMLDSGKIDLLAYEVPITAQYRDRVVPCGTENITHQVLVQPKHPDSLRITDVTELVGREVYVEDNSKYYHRMRNLNDELGGGIIIKSVKKDTLITEDLIEMVSKGEIPLTVVDSDIAGVNKTYYPDLDITLEVSFPQRSSWAVSPTNKWLADTINLWSSQEVHQRQQASLMKRYYERSKQLGNVYLLDFSKGKMSPFDKLFKTHAREIGWDWRLLSAMGYTESRYDSTQVSWAGAKGVMQLMPATARAFGLGADRITNVDASIATAVKVISSLDQSLKSYVSDPAERRKFVLAAYNSGLAHIIDAIAIAQKYGYKSTVWDGNVAEALLLKSRPEYYNDPVCKYGYFHGRQTYDYVRNVMACYDKAVKQIKR